jgi:hypothetical protein
MMIGGEERPLLFFAPKTRRGKGEIIADARMSLVVNLLTRWQGKI